ncbi:hypothetical protein NC653_017627 [Populus alba x Populus x berolinensis]|uniref:Uncharacterized protein n=1 Tax=Populus alba x Populus x berolinensis TaxID=444605 RepID=A0AAD6QR38_9ROSI|nr:hypothetical protein NC653_017627 [Populus alba x Populus x berolinensis]
MPYKLKFGLSCLLETIITLSILLQALSSILQYSIAILSIPCTAQRRQS